MIIYLRYATDSQTRKLPPFVDSGDGDSEETGLTIANTDILIGKPGGTTLTAKHSGGATHISNGIYYATFDSSDSDTVGNGEIYVHKSGALFAFCTLVVLPAKVYDSLFLGSDNLEVDVIQLLGTAWLTPAVAGTPDVNAKTVADKTGYSGSGTVTDKTGFSLLVTPPSASTVASQVRTELAAELARIDAAISTRLASTGYTAPANADIATLLTRLSAARAGYLDTLLSLAGMLEEDGVVYRFTENALELGPGGASAGARANTYTAYESDGSTPMAGCEVWATSDEAGANEIANRGLTNDAGQHIFYFDLAVGTTVYIWRRKSGETFTNPDTEVVA